MMPVPPSKLAATTSAPQFLSSHHETNLCCSLTDTTSIALLLQANTPPWQASACSSGVVARLFGGSVGFTSPPVVLPSRLQQLWAYQTIAHGWPGSLGQPSRKSSDLLRSHLCWFACMKANELTSSAPKTLDWRPARAEPARTMTMPPSKLAATTSATQVLSSHHELALCSSLTETHSLLPYCKQTPDHDKLQQALAESMLCSLGPRLASRRPWRYLRADRSRSGRARPSHIVGLKVWVNHHENCPISLTSLLVCMHESE